MVVVPEITKENEIHPPHPKSQYIPSQGMLTDHPSMNWLYADHCVLASVHKVDCDSSFSSAE